MAPEATIRHFPPGEEISSPQPGDFLLLCEGNDFFSRLIRFGQRLRFRGKAAQYTRWNHAALFYDDLGGIIEALSSGVTAGNVSRYAPKDYVVVHIQASDADRLEVVTFAVSCLNDGYGWLTIASIILSVLTGSKLSIGYDGQEICSGLVARSLERTSAIFPRDASHLMPADLAQFYGVNV